MRMIVNVASGTKQVAFMADGTGRKNHSWDKLEFILYSGASVHILLNNTPERTSRLNRSATMISSRG